MKRPLVYCAISALAVLAFANILIAADAPASGNAQPSLAVDGIPEPTSTVKVASLGELAKAIAAAKPGTQIVLADGVYTSAAPIEIKAKGTAEHPIVISAQTIGGAEINGVGSFVFDKDAAYVVLRGFKFTHAPAAVKVPAGANHCRVSRNIFELKVGIDERSTFCEVAADDTEIDHNEFLNKQSEGQMLLVIGPGTSEMAQRVWIHHNYFHDFKSPHKNNCSAIHIGMSGRSLTPAWSVTESNLFVKCAGENEGCICNKCCDNIYRFNTFGEGSTELSVRHGNRCDVYANFFIGCEGVRFFGHDHRIYSNYFERCKSAIQVGNGDGIVPEAKLTSHDKPVGVQVVFNTLVNNRANIAMGGRNNGLGAADTVIADNIIYGGPKAAAIAGPMENATWQGNIAWKTDGVGTMPSDGVKEIDPKLKADASGEFRLESADPAASLVAGSYPYVTVDVNGLPRNGKPDVGAEQFSDASNSPNRILQPADVGILAVEATRTVPDFNWGAKRAAAAK